jgi:SAM-dependent methyltransferase
MSVGTMIEDVTGLTTLEIIADAKQFNKWMYEAIKPGLKGKVLELGSGIGNISSLLLDDKFETVLSDYNSFYANHLTEKFKGYSNLEAVLSVDLQAPDFETIHASLYQRFDSVFLLNVIEHLAHDSLAISNCKYMLKPGGHLILLAPSYQFLYCDLDKNLGHYRRYTVNSLGSLLMKNGMTLVKKKYFNLAGIFGWFIWGKILGKQQLQKNSMKLFNRAVPLLRLADQLTFQKIGLSAIVTGKK